MNSFSKWGYYSNGQAANVEGDELAVSAVRRGAPIMLVAEDPSKQTIRYQDSMAYVQDGDFHERPAPKYYWGQEVKIIGRDSKAAIEAISWHFNQGKYYYQLIQNDKLLSRRFFEDDLESSE